MLTKIHSSDTMNAILRKDPKMAGRRSRLKKDCRTRLTKNGLGKEGKTGVQPTASKKDKTVDPALTMFKSNDKADSKSISAENLPLNQSDQEFLKMLSRAGQQMIIQLTRECRLRERLERRERKRLEEVEWKPPRTDFGNFSKNNFRATGFSKEEKTGRRASMLRSKPKKANPNMDTLELLKMPFILLEKLTKRLISYLDLIESWEWDQREDLQAIPW